MPSILSVARKSYSLVLFLIIWQAISHFKIVPAFFLPSIPVILARGYEATLSGQLPHDLGVTLFRAMLSLFLASSVGIPLGMMMARMKYVRWFFDPILSIGLPAPKVSFIPIFILWFGFGDMSKIMLTFFACTFPIVNTTYLGAIGIDRYLVWSAQNMGTKKRPLFWRIVLPATLPQIFSGLQIAFPISLIVTTVIEMLRGGGGIGAAMMQGSRFADMPIVFINLIALALFGSISMDLLRRLRRLLLHWHQEADAPT